MAFQIGDVVAFKSLRGKPNNPECVVVDFDGAGTVTVCHVAPDTAYNKPYKTQPPAILAIKSIHYNL